MTNQIIRGGCWDDCRGCARADYRFDCHPDVRDDVVGFRVIKKSQQNYPVVRGGSWNNPQDYARSAYRLGLNPFNRSSGIGFRVLKQRSTQ